MGSFVISLNVCYIVVFQVHPLGPFVAFVTEISVRVRLNLANKLENPSAAEDKEVSACSRGRCAGRPPCTRPSIPLLMFPRRIQGLFPPLPFLFSDVVSVSSGSRFVKTFVGSSQQRRRGAGR